METQTLNQKCLDEGESITFAPREWQYFVQELNDMIAEGKFDVIQAVNNARYLSMLDKSFKQLEKGKCVTFTDEEWEDFVNAQEFYGDGI